MGLLSKAIFQAETPLTRDRVKARIKGRVAEYQARHTAFQAIVFELQLCRVTACDTRKRLTSMVSSLGVVIPLNNTQIARDLALFPSEIDRELVIHRLGKSLGLMSPQSFEANSPDQAIALLEPFI